MWKSRTYQITRRVGQNLAAVVETATREIEARAKLYAPVDTGFLKNSIASEVTDQTGIVSVGAEYGVYVNFGTVRHAPNPFFTRAVEEVLASIGGELRKVL